MYGLTRFVLFPLFHEGSRPTPQFPLIALIVCISVFLKCPLTQ